jgi:hypothetical protein
MKGKFSSKIVIFSILAILTASTVVFVFPGISVFATTSCKTAGSTGLTTFMVATSNQKITKTTINATGCDLGIYIPPGTVNVVINQVTVTGAKQHGIFAQDANVITIENSLVTGNGVAGIACPPGGAPPPGCIAEDKAIELVGTSHSIIENNVVSHNSADGGIGIADDGALDPGAPNTHPGFPHQAADNLVKGNLIDDNSKGCGIVIAAYNAPTGTAHGEENGGVENTWVTENTIVGTAPTSGQLFPPPGSYIGQIVIATDAPNTFVLNTGVTYNTLDGSELPGIVVHANVFGDVIKRTYILSNTIAENGYYPGPPATNPNDPGVSQGTTGIALIAEVGVQPPHTTNPVLSYTYVNSANILGDTNGVWMCGTTHTSLTNMQGNPTFPTVTCEAGGS